MLCGITNALKLDSLKVKDHSFAVCFLLAGLYILYTYEVSLQSKSADVTPVYAVRPTYILVE